MKILAVTVICVALILVSASALRSQDREKEFQAIGKMTTSELAPKAKAAIEKKYPDEDWAKYSFPKYVYVADAVTTGYKIAVKEPELLAKFPCYCFCEGMGHKNLSYCFLQKGTLRGGFDSHAANCNICINQAMMAFLWNEIGTDPPKMQQGMKQIFERK